MPPSPESLSKRAAADIRDLLVSGRLKPGMRLSEEQMAETLQISRNTLREAFRQLTTEGLLQHHPNRGVFVRAPDSADIIDIYRVRRAIQTHAIAHSTIGHPALTRMRAAVETAKVAASKQDWDTVGTTNMDFHRAMADLCDSQRISTYFESVLAELRLVFLLMDSPAYLHEPYVPLNERLIDHLDNGRIAEATAELDAYLLRSERAILAALARAKP